MSGPWIIEERQSKGRAAWPEMVLLKCGKGGWRGEVRPWLGLRLGEGGVGGQAEEFRLQPGHKEEKWSLQLARERFPLIASPFLKRLAPRSELRRAGSLSLCGLASVSNPAKVKDLSSAKSLEKFSSSCFRVSPLAWSVSVSCWHSRLGGSGHHIS